MKQFSYLVPKNLDEAISLHVAHGERAKYIAGGTDVLVKIKEGKLAPDYLISLRHIIAQDRPFLNHEMGALYRCFRHPSHDRKIIPYPAEVSYSP